VSDDQYFSEFGNTLDERSRQRLESNLSVTQRWEKWNLVARLFTYEDLLVPESIELQRLPEVRLNAFQQPVPGLPDLLYEFEGSYNNFVRDIGSDGQRLDVRPRLSYPVSPGGLFTMTPRVGFRETVYDTKVIGTKVEKGFAVEDTSKELVTRSLFETGVDLQARAYRVFDMGGAFGIQRLQHVIEPRISYNFADGDDSDELPQFDSIDAIRPGHTVTYSLINRLKARAVGEGATPGRVWEVVRLTFSQIYDIDPIRTTTTTPATDTTPAISTTTTEKRLSDLQADLIIQPLFGVRFRGSAAVDPYETRFTSATTDAYYDAANWRVSFGTRHGQSGRLQFIQGSAQAKLGTRWGVRFSSNYDVESRTVIENRVEVAFHEQCWAITAAFVDRSNEDEFHITINLLELGQYGFGRAFGSLQ